MLVETLPPTLSSFPRKRESSDFAVRFGGAVAWIPAFAGMTAMKDI